MRERDERQTRTAAETTEAVGTLLRRALTYWKRSLFLGVLAAIVGVPAVFLQPRVYRSETVISYHETLRGPDGESAPESARRGRLREMLLSRASLEPLVSESPRFLAIAERRGMIDAVDELRSHITFRPREGEMFEIGFEGLSPTEVQETTRRLGDRFIDGATARRKESAHSLTAFIEAESEQNNVKLRAADSDLATLLAEHPELYALVLPGDPSAQRNSLLPSPVAAPIGAAVPSGRSADPAVRQLEGEARGIEARLRIDRREGATPPSAAAAAPDCPEVSAARAELTATLARVTPRHPDAVTAQEAVRAALAACAKRTPKAEDTTSATTRLTRDERAALEQRLATLRAQIAARGGGSAVSPLPSGSGRGRATTAASIAPGASLEVELRRRQRDVADFAGRQKQLDDKLFKARLAEDAAGKADMTIIDAAYLPRNPISRARSTSLAACLLAAALLALLTALASARLDDRIYGRADLDLLDAPPLLGVVAGAVSRR